MGKIDIEALIKQQREVPTAETQDDGLSKFVSMEQAAADVDTSRAELDGAECTGDPAAVAAALAALATREAIQQLMIRQLRKAELLDVGITDPALNEAVCTLIDHWLAEALQQQDLQLTQVHMYCNHDTSEIHS